jgi:hypothetical protein
MKASLDVKMRSVAHTTKRLERAIERAQHQAVSDTLENTIDEGKQSVYKGDAIWKWQTYESFKWTRFRSNSYHVLNTAPYAGAVDKGADFDDHPPADDLVPWVLDNLQDWHPIEEEARERLNLDPDASLDPTGDDDDPSGDSPESFTSYGGDNSDIDSTWSPGGDDSSRSSGYGSSDYFSDDDSSSSSSGGSVGWGDVSETDDGPEDISGQFTVGTAPYSFRPLRSSQLLSDIGNPTVVSGSISDLIDYDDVTKVTSGVVGSDFTYSVLAKSTEDALLSKLRNEYGDAAVDTITSDIQRWKETTFVEEGAHLEAIAKQRYNIDSPIRGEDQFDIPEVTPEQRQAFHELSISSHEVLARNHATSGKLQLYRGMNTTQSANFVKSIIENPRADSWNVETSVIQNYTLNPETAEKFSQGIEIGTTVDLNDDVLLAPDFVLDDTHDGLRNSEVWVFGGDRGYSADTLTIDGHLANDLMKKAPWNYTEAQLEAIELLVNGMYEKGTKIETQNGAAWLREWLDAYEDEFGDTENYKDKIESIIQL